MISRKGLLALALLIFAPSLLAAPPAPSQADVAYGPHERNRLDFWQAEAEGPRPLLVYIHGGGWTQGDKSKNLPEIGYYLEKGISVAAINYRYSTQAPLPAPVHDAARAIQFLKTKADEWKLDPERFVLTGGSAGACTSMWILLHDDLADPTASDPVARASSRVAGAAVYIGQTSIDPKQSREWLGDKVLEHRMINLAVGEKTMADCLKNYARHEATFREFSPYTHLDAADPPLLMFYFGSDALPSKNGGHGIHHPEYGRQLQKKARQLDHDTRFELLKKRPAKVFELIRPFVLETLLDEKP
ncbi:MAG: alpha/beta hydrolase fold domain-containing protein [Verrucomicrobiales bacterium]